MSTHETHETTGTQTSPRGLPSWRPLVLAALIPLAAACTETLTGPTDSRSVEPVQLQDEYDPETESVEDFEDRIREERL